LVDAVDLGLDDFCLDLMKLLKLINRRGLWFSFMAFSLLIRVELVTLIATSDVWLAKEHNTP